MTATLPTLPSPASTFTGKSDWQMKIAKSWQKVDTGQAEAVWYTGGGTATRPNSVAVVVEKPPVPLTMQQYLDVSTTSLEKSYPDLVTSSSEVIEADGRELGRLRYHAKVNGVEVEAVTYVSELTDGWAVAGFVTPKGQFDRYAPDVEPYLATLQPSA